MNIFKNLIKICVLCVTGCKFSTNSTQKESLPNIIILLADDLGYGDLSCYGGTAQTPNLDQLAKEGIRFTDFYSAAPNCSPSRVGLLTGRSPSKVGMYNYMPAGHPMHLPDDAITLAEIVKQKGYRTGHFGKWHLSNLSNEGNQQQPKPGDQGFDYSLGTTNNAQPTHLNPKNFVRNGKETGVIEGYSCQIIVEEALEWLGNTGKKESPFMMYLAFHEPHKKIASPPTLTAKYDEYPFQIAEYFANVENMDAAIGNLLKGLKNKGLDENTMIVFSSDNGSYRNGSNAPLLGGKSFVYEGGIRVPGILNWKGKVKGNQVIAEPVSLIDLMPTICDITEATHPTAEILDGISLLPLLEEKTLERNKPLSWFFYRTTPEIAMRIGDYTILGIDKDTTRHTHRFTEGDMDYIKNMDIEDFELYNVKLDKGQHNPINLNELDLGKKYKTALINRLEEIQKEGHYWDTLPPTKGLKRLKKDWRTLRPTGFGN
jgi:arylsulfatase A